MLLAVAETVTDQPSIATVLTDTMSRAGMSERALAMYLGVSANAVNSWVRGIRTPDPQYCWKIAKLAHLPIEFVMRLAGHLPPLEDERETEAEPDWYRLLPMLSRRDAEYVARLVESLVRNPAQPDEPPGQEAPQ